MSDENLLSGFDPVSLEQWKQKIEKDLKGKDYEGLRTQSPEGIIVEPIYNSSSKDAEHQPFKTQEGWEVVQEVVVENESTSNKEALDHLNRGASSLLFYVQSDVDLQTLLKDIGIEYIRTNFIVEGDLLVFATNISKLLTERGLQEDNIRGSINADCLEILARTGNWVIDEKSDFDTQAALRKQAPRGMQTYCINSSLFSNAGAHLAQQLGISLAMAYEYAHRLELNSTDGFWINFGLGSDYFGEIAKLRAFRRLWTNLNLELGQEASEPFIYVETGFRNKTIMDAHNNMIRTTSEAMAAAIGGANEISVKGFNQTFKAPDFFGERVAKNQLSILEHESHLKEVNDISKGSYFIELLTEELTQKGWEFFTEIEKQGGYVESLKSGWLQGQVEAEAAKEQEAFDACSKVLIGANKHAKPDEDLAKLMEQPMFSSSTPKESTVKRIRAVRLAEKLEAGMRKPSTNESIV